MHYLCVNYAKSAKEKTMMEFILDDDGILDWKCQDDDGIQKDDDGIRKDDDGIQKRGRLNLKTMMDSSRGNIHRYIVFIFR